jgi:hypothetical protein
MLTVAGAKPTAARTASVVLIFVFACASIWATAPASAQTQRSNQVAVVLGEGSGSAGSLQTAGVVAGSPDDSFDQFTFASLSQEEIDPGTLAQYDTVVLNQVFTSSLSEGQKQTLSNFVTGGGKLIIHDADGTEGNEYSWLPVPAETGQSCLNCGDVNGEATITENNTIVSNDPASPYYIDVDELPFNSDAAGDANVLVTTDPRWDEDIRASNGQNVEGAADAYASDGGLIMYNGFDDDAIEAVFPSGNDWLDKIWYDELSTQWNPDSLPHANPVVGASGHCGFRSIRVGVAVVCAEVFSSSGSETTASGNVVLDGGISVGNGPVEINRETKQISVPTPAPISILRNAGPLSLGTAAFSIDASGTTDPTSGVAGLAKVTLTSAGLGALASLQVGNLPVSLPVTGTLSMYLDSAQGGGLVGSGTIGLPVLGKLQPSGALSLGFFAASPSPAVLLGAAAHFGAIEFGKGWKFAALDLTYQEPTDTWTASGGLEVPIGSLSASGSLSHGQLESLHVAIGGQDVPLGDSGFFFTGFGGGVSGLAKGPLKISASTEGFWGAPKAPVEPFYLDNATVTVNFGGSISLDGAVSFVLKSGSPLHGQLDLKLSVNPFSAGGTASIDGELPLASFHAHGGAGFTTKHFTAAEGGLLKVFGFTGNGEVIASDSGLGASGTLCAPFHIACQSIALAGNWSQIGRFDVPSIIGGNPQKLITVSGVAAAGQSAAIRVTRGQSLLLIAARSSSVPPAVRLRSPSGKTYGPIRSSRSVIFTHQPRFGLTMIAVIAPHAGLWHLASAVGSPLPFQVQAQTVRPYRLIHASAILPRSSARHPLDARGTLTLRWSSSNLPPGVRVAIVRHSAAHQVGVGLVGGLRATGRYTVPVSKLAPGRNTITLAATLNGVPFQQVTFHGVAWRPTPRPKRQSKPRKHTTRR